MISLNNFREESQNQNNNDIAVDSSRSKSLTNTSISKKRNRSPLTNKTKPLSDLKSLNNSDMEFSNRNSLKTENNINLKENVPSYRILEPYRSLGLITSDTKFVYYKRNNARFILLSNSNSFLLYNLEKLKLERISPPLASKITAVAMINNLIYTASENTIIAWNKIHIVRNIY